MAREASKDKTPTRRLIKKEGGRRPPSKMTRVSQMTREASKDKTRPQQGDSLKKKVAEGQSLR